MADAIINSLESARRLNYVWFQRHSGGAFRNEIVTVLRFQLAMVQEMAWGRDLSARNKKAAWNEAD